MRTVYVDGLRHVLEASAASVTRFVYASSTGVYGQTDGEWVDETSPTCPQHESGQVCLEAEERDRASGPTRTSVRPRRSSCDSRASTGRAGLVRRSILERGEPIPGDPHKFLNLIHIDDAARRPRPRSRPAEPSRSMWSATTGRSRAVSTTPGWRRSWARPRLGSSAARPGSPEAARDATNKRVDNHRIKSGLGIALIYPDITTGLRSCLASPRCGSDPR